MDLIEIIEEKMVRKSKPVRRQSLESGNSVSCADW